VDAFGRGESEGVCGEGAGGFYKGFLNLGGREDGHEDAHLVL